MTNTYTPIASVTLSATASEVVFSGLPQTFRDLIVVVEGTTSVGINGSIYFNNDTTGGNYPYVRMNGNGSTTSSNSGNNIAFDFQTTRSNVILQVMDYTQTKHKTVLSRWGDAANVMGATAIRWANTAAVNQITIKDTNNSATFSSGSTFTIFGVIA